LDVIKSDRRVLSVAAPNSIEKNVKRGVEEVKLDSSSEVSCAGPEGVALRPRPGSPLDHGIASKSQDLLGDFPLKLLDSLPGLAVPQIDAEVGHPLVGTKANCIQLLLNLLGVRGLA